MKSSIARKFVMAISGLFLITFLITHLTVNAFSLGWGWDGEKLFNQGSHFMATNPIIQGMQFVLAAGFLIHIIWGIKLTLENNKARPQKYAYNKPGENSSFSARSMIYSGVLVLLFLILHLKDFFLMIKIPGVFGDKIGKYAYTQDGVSHSVQNDFSLMDLFVEPLYVIIYVIAFIALGIHLNHGFQSAFQSLGANHSNYTPKLKVLGKIFSILIAAGFSAIAITHYINSLS